MANVICINQPYAELYVSGERRHDFRSRKISPSWYYIHASGKPFVFDGIKYHTGQICGAVLIDTVYNTVDLPWVTLYNDAYLDDQSELSDFIASNPYAWHTSEAIIIEQHLRPNIKGHQGIWHIDPSLYKILMQVEAEIAKINETIAG